VAQLVDEAELPRLFAARSDTLTRNIALLLNQSPRTGLMVDRQPPTITVSTPAPIGSTGITLGATVTPVFSCNGYNPDRMKSIGSTFPINLQLCDATGHNLSSAKISLAAYSVDGGPPPPPTFSGNSNFGNSFRYDSSTKCYIYNLSTGGQVWSTPGMQVMYFSVNSLNLPASVAPFTLG
jgi:hypothetical protein